MLEDYEADFRCLSAEIAGLVDVTSRRAEAQASGRFGGRSSHNPGAAFGDLENRMREASRVLNQMTLEVRLMPPAQRRTHEVAIKDHKDSLDNFAREIETLRRRVLLGEGQALARQQWAASHGIDLAKEEQSREANAAKARLLAASRQLEMTRVLVQECEDMGAKTCEDLGRNTEIIKNVKTNVNVVSGELASSSLTTRRMLTRETLTDLFFRGACWLCFGLAGFAVIYYFSHHHK